MRGKTGRGMPASTIDLTEPARSLFAQTGPLLEEWLPRILPPNTSWCMGGGTILAAQWQHRVSTDIDIFLPARAGVAALSPAWDGRFVDEMAALGATHLMAGEHNYTEDAPGKILAPATHWEHLLADGPRKVIEIMDGFAYREVDLSYFEGSATVLVETNRGEVFSEHFQGPQDLLAGLFGLGLEEWVLANYGTIEAFLTMAASSLQFSRNDAGGDETGGGSVSID